MIVHPLAVSRRHFQEASVGVVASGAGSPRAASTRQRSGTKRPPSSAKALVFDVFGTVVDWRTSVARQVDELGKQKGLTIDGAAFADAWRAEYAPSMDRVRKGELPWTKLDQLHRMPLDQLLPKFGLERLSESEKASLNKAWHRLDPWPDTVAGLTRLKRKFIIAPLSNGNVSLMTNLAKFGSLPWDCILGAELAKHYKPDPEVYRSAAEFLDLSTADVMMVAAHLADLRAAKAVGLQTAFVVRPAEFGNSTSRRPELQPDDSVDVSAKDFGDLATQLGA
jgi:2-haloacid dehalogenase